MRKRTVAAVAATIAISAAVGVVSTPAHAGDVKVLTFPTPRHGDREDRLGSDPGVPQWGAGDGPLSQRPAMQLGGVRAHDEWSERR